MGLTVSGVGDLPRLTGRSALPSYGRAALLRRRGLAAADGEAALDFRGLFMRGPPCCRKRRARLPCRSFAKAGATRPTAAWFAAGRKEKPAGHPPGRNRRPVLTLPNRIEPQARRYMVITLPPFVALFDVGCWLLFCILPQPQPASALIGDECQAPGQNSHIHPLKQRPFP